MIERLIIKNYKSIRELDLRLHPLNVLIGSNGAGKSNFVSFFQLARHVYEGTVRTYSEEKGANNLLYQGLSVSETLEGLLDFDNANAYKFVLRARNEDSLFVDDAGDYWNGSDTTDKNYEDKWHWKSMTNPWREDRNRYTQRHMMSFRIYHFHDTRDKSAMRRACAVDDNQFLREDGANLAAFLYLLQKNHPKHFQRIVMTVRSIAPFFEKFELKPRQINAEQIKLEWKEKESDMYQDAHNFSDGTLRFIALSTLLLQPDPPKTIIIDEPELGLHPFAIHKLGALLRKASAQSQIIVSTQSVELVNQFEAEDILVVDREDGQSVFTRLDSEKLANWLDEFSLGDIWQKNVIGGQPH